MKITIVNKHKEHTLGGSEIQCDIIARYFTLLGHQVHYVAVEGRGISDRDYSVVPVKNDPDDIACSCIDLAPDLIYWRFNKHCFYRTVKKIKKHYIPVVFAVSHKYDLQKWGTKRISNQRNFIKKWILQVYNSLQNRWNYQGFNHIDAMVVNNREFLGKADVRSQFYVPSSVEDNIQSFSRVKPYVLWIGGLKESKQPEICLQLARDLRETGTDVVLIGRPGNQFHLFENGIPENLNYVGEKNLAEVNGALKNCICLIHTGDPEGFPNTFMQAWRQGKPVVSLNYDPDNLLKNKGLGFYSESQYPGFVDQVKNVIENPSLRNSFEKRVKEFSKEWFDPEVNVRKLEQLFEEILSQNRG